MKVLISTYHNEMNFGAALQSYALQRTLSAIGLESTLLSVNNKKKIVKNGLKDKVKRLLNRLYNLKYKKDIQNGRMRFNEFFDSYHITSTKYNSLEELLKNPPEADVYLSGSDQVFNPINMRKDFFLQFGKESVKRISYAASLGVKKIPEEKRGEFKKFIDDFDKISLRETMAVDEFKKVTGVDAEVNIDPSFLVSEEHWQSLQDNKVADRLKKPYILVYVIYKPKWLSKRLYQLKQKTGREIVVVSYSGFSNIYYDQYIVDAGPREFLGLVANADMVISSSFHGNVFSAIYKKPFYAVVNPKAPDRIRSLLNLFGLSDRELKSETSVDEIEFGVDYREYDRVLPIEIKRAIDYLSENLLGE